MTDGCTADGGLVRLSLQLQFNKRATYISIAFYALLFTSLGIIVTVRFVVNNLRLTNVSYNNDTDSPGLQNIIIFTLQRARIYFLNLS